MTVKEARELFPELSRKIYGKQLVYFDNAASSLRPSPVVQRYDGLATFSTSNIHRAVHMIAGEATDAYEEARDEVRAFLNASCREEIIFTSGVTMALNLVAESFSRAFLEPGDEIIVSESEHHSNLVPWQIAAERYGAVLRFLRVDENGRLITEDLDQMMCDRTKLVAVTHISNVLGLVNPVKEIIRKSHSKGIPVLIDGAQGIVHETVDVQDLDCDFYAFSGHKMYAATGTGVLYGKKEWLEKMPPYMYGGEMVGTVTLEKTSFAPLPMKFEAGTQNYTSVPTFKEAIIISKLLRDSDLQKENKATEEYMLDALTHIDGLRLYGVPRGTTERKAPVFSFSIEGVHHEDLALILDKMGIAVRSGQMCAEPLMTRYGVTGMLRASLAPYNTMEEAEYFVASLKKAKGMLL